MLHHIASLCGVYPVCSHLEHLLWHQSSALFIAVPSCCWQLTVTIGPNCFLSLFDSVLWSTNSGRLRSLKLIVFLKEDHSVVTSCGPVRFSIQMNWLVSLIFGTHFRMLWRPFLTYFVIYCVARTFHMHKFVKWEQVSCHLEVADGNRFWRMQLWLK